MSVQLISRRATLRGLAVAVGAGVVGFFVARNSKAATSRGQTTAANGYGYGAAPVATGQPLATLASIKPNGGLILAKEKVVLTRDSGDGVHGFSSICTHQGCMVGSVSGGAIDCPCHGSRFDAATGAVLDGPATEPLPKVAVVVRDGSVYPQ